MTNARNHLIDLLRFIAATWVALFHFNETVNLQENWYRYVLKLGYLGVPIFFVISGYCIMLAADHSSSAKDFIIRRFFRIFPAFWFSMIVVLTAIAFSMITIGYNSVTTLPKDAASIFLSISLLTVPFSKVEIINWVYWSLTYEIFFYLIIWLYLYLPKKMQYPWLLMISILSIFIPKHEGWFFFFAQHWPSFLLGMAVYFIVVKKESIMGGLFLTSAIIGLFYNVIHHPYFQLSCIITASLICISNYHVFRENFFSKLGDYSYAIYLIHVPIGVYIFGSIKQIALVQKNILLNISWDVFLYIIIVCIAKFIFIKIEKPFILIGKKISTNFSNKNISSSNPI
ncbi:MAG TPA: acyltransferase [Pedobacter sp.]|nr:acyltransferase [Pedobacter sp.]